MANELQITACAPDVFVVSLQGEEIGTIQKVSGGYTPSDSDGLWASFELAVGFLVLKKAAELKEKAERLTEALFYTQEKGRIQVPQVEAK